MKSEMSGIPVFVAAAESVSFSQAAEKLHVGVRLENGKYPTLGLCLNEV
ncbi:helix-turn-helix domain-containing protein [Serratia proteamaculans]